jgi:RNA polymerase primary sigma factor
MAGSDAVTFWLDGAGRQPLLTTAEEVHLGGLVRCWQDHPKGPELAPALIKRRGIRARDRFVSANLRLVAHVCRITRPALGAHITDSDLPDLLQAGAIGLMRGAERFDPARGYKFSTYAYWWIRQGMTRAIDNSARTIRLPIHISEKLSKMRRISRELSHRLGRQPNRLELSHAMDMQPEELEELITQSAPCASLDAHARGDEDRSTLGELIADPASNEHMDSMDRHLQKEHLGAWMAQLNEREQKIIKLRFGLEGAEPLTLAEIGRLIDVSRERVRQLESKAIMKLRLMSNVQQAA